MYNYNLYIIIRDGMRVNRSYTLCVLVLFCQGPKPIIIAFVRNSCRIMGRVCVWRGNASQWLGPSQCICLCVYKRESWQHSSFMPFISVWWHVNSDSLHKWDRTETANNFCNIKKKKLNNICLKMFFLGLKIAFLIEWKLTF